MSIADLFDQPDNYPTAIDAARAASRALGSGHYRVAQQLSGLAAALEEHAFELAAQQRAGAALTKMSKPVNEPITAASLLDGDRPVVNVPFRGETRPEQPRAGRPPLAVVDDAPTAVHRALDTDRIVSQVRQAYADAQARPSAWLGQHAPVNAPDPASDPDLDAGPAEGDEQADTAILDLSHIDMPWTPTATCAHCGSAGAHHDGWWWHLMTDGRLIKACPGQQEIGAQPITVFSPLH